MAKLEVKLNIAYRESSMSLKFGNSGKFHFLYPQKTNQLIPRNEQPIYNITVIINKNHMKMKNKSRLTRGTMV